MVDCIFCKIIRGEISSDKIYEDESTLAFLDIDPAAKGHVLVISKKHHKTLDEMDKESLSKLMVTVKKICGAIKKFSENYNVIQNNGKLAGQIVNHVHFHIIPRHKNDGIGWDRPSLKMSKDELLEIRNKIKNLLK